MKRRPALLVLSAVIALAAYWAPTATSFAAERPGAARCETWRLREMVGEKAWSSGARSSLLACDHTPVGPPPNPQVGDSWNWYIWRLNGFPAADLRSCTVRGMGPNCYVVVEDSQWNVRVNQAQVDTIIAHFETRSIGPFANDGIWDLDVAHFGVPPDYLDQDPRVYILYYDFDVSSDGFFWGFDQECDDVAQFHSNECDVVYMNCSDFDPAGSYLLAVLAHEFEHLIHYNYDPDESAWVDEGLAELAMWLYGDPDNISQFNTNPDRSLITFNGNWYDYIKSYLFTLYFYERFGGQGGVRMLTQEPANSIAGYENVLDAQLYVENFEDAFADWAVANYLDDTTIGDGRFGYVGESLPAFVPFATHSTYPVGPNAGAVNHWAADYVRYVNGNSLQMTFDGVDNTKFAVRALLRDPVTPTAVLNMTLNAAQAGVLPLPQLGTTYNEVVMVHAGILSTGGTTYQYGAQTGIVETAGLAAIPAVSLRVLRTGSSVPSFVFDLPAASAGEAVRLDLFDASGRLARRLVDTRAVPGRHEAAWDGLGASGEALAAGIYFARLTVGREVATARATLVR